VTTKDTSDQTLSTGLSGTFVESAKHDSGPPAQEILLEQKKIQDTVAALLQQTPTFAYIVVSLVYSPLMFVVQNSALTSVWIAFSLNLIIVGFFCTYRAVSALRNRNAYEMVALRTPSDPFPTDEAIWGDRLAEIRQITARNPIFGRPTLYNLLELVVWLVFAAVVHTLAYHVV
jgi:hypothetical protein